MEQKKIRLTLELPDGAFVSVGSVHEFSAVSHLLVDGPPGPGQDGSRLAESAQKAMRLYLQWRQSFAGKKGKKLRYPLVFRQGGGLAMCACYIAGWSVGKTRDYLHDKHGLSVSNGAAGRVFRGLSEMKIFRSPKPLDVNL